MAEPKLKRFPYISLGIWMAVWALGLFIGVGSLIQIAADGHRWDARVPLQVSSPGSAESAAFRTLTGGEAVLYATSLVHGLSQPALFEGRLEIALRDAAGRPIYTAALGSGGVGYQISSDLTWLELATLEAPLLWVSEWVLAAQVVEADPDFPAERIDLVLRKRRPDLGMGGMIFYVTIFAGLGLLGVATGLSLLLLRRGLRWPLGFSLLSWVPVLWLSAGRV